MPRSYAEATNKVFQERRFEADGSRDVSGIAEEVGPGPAAAGQFKKGDEVFAMADPTRDGAYADYIAIHGTALALKPKSLNHASKSRICRLSDGCATCSRCVAARETLSISATATK
jgi:NADPH:quinone reductase-like Zn-dependent oxidoreductase